MPNQDKQSGKVAPPADNDRSGNYDKVRNQPAVNQGISNAGPSGNRNDRADKANNSPDGHKGKPGNRSGSKNSGPGH